MIHHSCGSNYVEGSNTFSYVISGGIVYRFYTINNSQEREIRLIYGPIGVGRYRADPGTRLYLTSTCTFE